MGNYRVNIDSYDHYEMNSDDFINTLKLYKNGDIDLLDKLVKANIKLVLSICNRYSNKKESMDDLFQVGCIGLIKSINNFDLSLGLQFSTYAVPMIIGEIKRYLRDNGAIKISRQIKDLAYQVLKFKEEYMNDTGEDLDIYELSKMMNVPIFKIKEALDSTVDVSSLNEKIGKKDNENLFLIDMISDSDDYDFVVNTITLHEGMNSLNDLERRVITDRYYKNKTQEEIADELMVSQAQISRLEKGAINSLKSFF